MIRALTLLFLCQLVGETVVRAAELPFPGPVLGMGLLFASLLVYGRSGPDLDGVADGILRNLSLLFVPVAVGLVQQLGLIAENALAIGAALVVSTVLTLVVIPVVYYAAMSDRRENLLAE